MESLGKRAGEAGWVKAQNTHLTLQFLGDIDEATIASVAKGLKRAAKKSAPFTLTTEKVAMKGERLLWLAFKPSVELNALKEALDWELEAAGIERDKRSFAPHLTLRRFRKRADYKEFKKRFADSNNEREISFQAEMID